MVNYTSDKGAAVNGAMSVAPAELAESLNLKRQVVGGKVEYHGANPFEAGATKDGFWINEDGTAHDRNSGQHYTSWEVARLANLSPDKYEPCRQFREQNGHSNGAHLNGHTNRHSAAKTATAPKPATAPLDWSCATIHEYRDESGALLFQVGRVGSGDAKTIRQRRPNGRGDWICNLEGARRVLYNLPHILQAHTVLIVEGEKAADAINQRLREVGKFGAGGCVATTAPHGAGKFRAEYAEVLQDKAVTVLPDNDEPGASGANAALRVLDSLNIKAKRVELPDLPPKGDAADYLASNGDVLQLLALCAAAPTWTPEADAPETMPPAKPRYALHSLSALSQRPKQEHLIYRVLGRGGTSLLTAKHASFKTFFSLDMALSIACGLDWHGHLIKQGTVVYIVAEGAGGFTKRVRAFCSEHEVPFPTNFFVIDVPVQIAEERNLRDFVAQLKEITPALIVFDTLARCAVGLEENSSKDMGQFAGAIGTLSVETGAHVMVVHHNNKNGEYRGSSALAAAVDTHISLERDGQGDHVTLKFEKQKDGEELPPMVFTKHVIDIDDGESSLVFRRNNESSGGRFTISDSEQKVLKELVESFGEAGATSSRWGRVCKDAGVSERAFWRAKERLINKFKMVICPNEKTRGAIYQADFSKCDWLLGAKVPEGANGTYGSQVEQEGAMVPHSLRSGTLAPNDVHEEKKPTKTAVSRSNPETETETLPVAPSGTYDSESDIFDDEPDGEEVSE